ncbi:hypothetical protein EXS57_02810 [Candidatus Kaiserbacteria bacterium]|nr:hypothetical protein [Candidatus Kaiserbacteria bacterium]
MPLIAALSDTQQQEAACLYRNGLSAQQIATHFSVSLDAAYYTLRKLKVPRRTAKETNKIRFELKPLSYNLKLKITAQDELLKTSAIMLYWAEGYKAGKGTVDFANSDPDMVLIFWKFLSEICRVDHTRVRLHLYAYEGQDVRKLMKFWCKLLKLPKKHFTKPYIKKVAIPGPRGPRMICGLVHIRYSDKKLLRQIMDWIDEYRAEMLG